MGEVWHRYIELMSDPAHLLAESTFVFIEYLIFSWMVSKVWSKFKKLLKREIKEEHLKIDKEHHVEHDDFYVEDEPLEKVRADFARGAKGRTGR